jgi:hypothetical protein
MLYMTQIRFQGYNFVKWPQSAPQAICTDVPCHSHDLLQPCHNHHGLPLPISEQPLRDTVTGCSSNTIFIMTEHAKERMPS